MEGSNRPDQVDPTWSDTSYYHNMLNDLGWSDDLQHDSTDLRDSRLAYLDEYQPSDSSQPANIKSPVRDEPTARSSDPAPVSSSSSEDPTEKSSTTTTTTTTVSENLNKVKQKGQKRVRQQRFAFMTKSEVDHLEDGYRWRKYGQKAVKNSPFPRSYYRCTNTKCTVKKRVERSSEDPGVVITTYEGQHCHHAIGYPRTTGFITHHGSNLLSHFGSSFNNNTSHLFYPQFHHQTSFFTNNNNSVDPQLTSTPRLIHVPQQQRQQPPDKCSTNQSPPRSSGEDIGQGLLGDIVPPLMRNPSDVL